MFNPAKCMSIISSRKNQALLRNLRACRIMTTSMARNTIDSIIQKIRTFISSYVIPNCRHKISMCLRTSRIRYSYLRSQALLLLRPLQFSLD